MTWTYLQRAKKWRETNNKKHIFRLFHNMGQKVLFSNTFSTQHLVAVIQVLLHGESWWKKRVKHLLLCVKRQLSSVFFTVYMIYFFLSGFRVTTSTRFANRSVFSVCIYRRSLMMNEDFANGSRNLLYFFIIKTSIRVNKGAGFLDLLLNISFQPLIILIKHSIIKLDVTELPDWPQIFTC